MSRSRNFQESRKTEDALERIARHEQLLLKALELDLRDSAYVEPMPRIERRRLKRMPVIRTAICGMLVQVTWGSGTAHAEGKLFRS